MFICSIELEQLEDLSVSDTRLLDNYCHTVHNRWCILAWLFKIIFTHIWLKEEVAQDDICSVSVGLQVNSFWMEL